MLKGNASARTVLHGAYDATSITAGVAALANGPARALWIGGAGNVDVTMLGGTAVTFVGVAAGTMLDAQVTHVTLGTTATDILALY
jgi:hypothetical protein